jgi:phospholipid transport system substrate-binding protein
MANAATAFGRRQAVFGLLGVASLSLLSGGIAAPARAADAAGAAAPVQSFNAALLRVMKAGASTPFATRYAMLEPAIGRAFDLNAILRVSVGAPWSSMTADEQAALAAAFRRYTVANFVANFDSYAGQTIEVAPDARSLANGDQVVSTRIGGPDGASIDLAYVMRQGPAGWQAVDVLAQGSISRVATQRSDFRTLLSNGGSAALVSSLESKVASLSGGSLA